MNETPRPVLETSKSWNGFLIRPPEGSGPVFNFGESSSSFEPSTEYSRKRDLLKNRMMEGSPTFSRRGKLTTKGSSRRRLLLAPSSKPNNAQQPIISTHQEETIEANVEQEITQEAEQPQQELVKNNNETSPQTTINDTTKMNIRDLLRKNRYLQRSDRQIRKKQLESLEEMEKLHFELQSKRRSHTTRAA